MIELTREEVEEWYANAGKDKDYEKFLQFAMGMFVISLVLSVTYSPILMPIGMILAMIVPSRWLDRQVKNRGSKESAKVE